MKNKDYKSRIAQLQANDSSRYAKYIRNAQMYYSSKESYTLKSLDSIVGYYSGYNSASTSNIQENIIYSCISTLVSKIASQKARPFINTINGTRDDINNAEATQQFFDVLFDEQNIYNTISMAFRDACIFDTGWIFINYNDKRVEKANPWNVYVDKAESANNHLNQVLYKIEQYPTSLLDVKTDKTYCTYYRYWNLKDLKYVEYIPELNIYKEVKYDENVLPFIPIYYEQPLNGNSSYSIVDLLYGIQKKINEILVKISEAVSLTPCNTFLVPEESTIKASKLNNQVGQVITYTATPNMTGSPVTVATPAFIDPQYMSTLNTLKQDAYEIVGISQLSAMSSKPAGLNSGIALSTMENIESDRFQTQLNQVLRLYTEVAKRIIELFPSDEDILPECKNRLSIKWKDIKKSKDKFSIQFSAADSLSKDPMLKMQQIDYLQAKGYIPASRVPSLLQLPDLELGYSFAANNLNAIQAIIDDCIDNENYDLPPYISLESLKPEILNTCLQLRANGSQNNKDIDKLLKLYQVCLDKEQSIGADEYLNQETEELDQQTMQLDMQNEQLTSIAEDLQNGVIGKEEAQAQIDNLGPIFN